MFMKFRVLVFCMPKWLYTAAHVFCFLYYFSSCLDINECELDSLNDCDGNADCVDTIGSYNCSCISGYEGNGFNCTGYTYFLVTWCIWSRNSIFVACTYGWAVDLFLFPDIDECQLGTDLCMNAECNNTAGSYICRPCFPGFIPENVTTCSKLCLHDS